MLRTLLFGLLACFTLVLATDITGNIVSNTTLELDAHVSLTSAGQPQRNSPIWESKKFLFEDVPEGVYALSVKSRRAQFQTYHITVPSAGNPIITLYTPGVGSIASTSFPHPLIIPSIGEPKYFDPPPTFNLIAAFKQNPLIIMVIVMALSMAGLPKLLSMLDPEIAAEVNKNQADMHAKLAGFGGDPTTSFSKFLASSDSPVPAQVEAAPPASPAKSSKADKQGARKRK